MLQSSFDLTASLVHTCCPRLEVISSRVVTSFTVRSQTWQMSWAIIVSFLTGHEKDNKGIVKENCFTTFTLLMVLHVITWWRVYRVISVIEIKPYWLFFYVKFQCPFLICGSSGCFKIGSLFIRSKYKISLNSIWL